MGRRRLLQSLLLTICLAVVVSAIAPHDWLTWFLETMPLLIALPLLIWSYQRFPLSSLLYVLITLQGLGLIAGAHYGFARVPLGFWLQDWLELSRNPYDRIGHFVQGLVPALLARELFLRKKLVRGQRMLPFVCFCVAMMVSAVYELVEWGAALALGADVRSFLGTQGDRWDAQADMFSALLGALTALTLLVPVHDRSLARLGWTQPAGKAAQAVDQ